MRFLHAADIHLDSPPAAVAQRGGDIADVFVGATRRALTKMVDFALQERVDFVLLAGDLWDGDWKDAHAGLYFVREAARLNAAGIPVVAVAGNHDAASATAASLTWPPNVRFLNARKPESAPLADGRVVVHGQGFAERAVTRNLAVGYPRRVEGAFNIGLLHTALEGAAEHAPYAPCSVDDLRGKGYDYWALGHVHAARIVARDPWIVYPGNLQGRHVRETGPKGCMLVTVEDGAVVAVDPYYCDVARWATATADLSGVDAWDEAMDRLRAGLAQATAGADGRPLAVRVTFTGTTVLDARLRARPQQSEAETLAAAEEVGGGIRIERVKIATRPPCAPAEPEAAFDTAADIVARLTDGDGEERTALSAALNEIRQAWPDWLKDAATLDDDEIIAGAAAQIADRLRGEDDAA